MLCQKIQCWRDVGRSRCFNQTGHLPPESLYSKSEKPQSLGSHLQSHILGGRCAFPATQTFPLTPRPVRPYPDRGHEIKMDVSSDPARIPTARKPQCYTDLCLPAACSHAPCVAFKAPRNLQRLHHTAHTLPPTCYSPDTPFPCFWGLCSCCPLLLPFNFHRPKSYLSF